MPPGSDNNMLWTYANEQNSRSAIFKLNSDLLEEIFLLNTNLEDDGQLPNELKLRALNTLRFSSQTCRNWREDIMGRPSLWGRVIDLFLLIRGKQEWRDEVIRRTGKCPLHIKGLVFKDPPTMIPFFSFLLKTHWRRIRYINIIVNDPTEIDRDVWRVLEVPTITLEFFRLRLGRDTPIFPEMKHLRIFSDDAPALRHFHSPGHIFEIRAPWLFQLQSLEIHGSRISSFTIPQLFDLLPQLPFLNFFSMNGLLSRYFSTHPDLSTLKSIDLPILEELFLAGEQGICSVLLERIIPHRGCSLRLTIHDGSSRADADALKAELSRYSKNYFDTRIVGELLLELSQDRLYVSDHINTKISLIPGQNSPTFYLFYVTQYLYMENLTTTCTAFLLGSLLSCRFTHITVLKVHLDAYTISESITLQMFLKLSSVEVIQTGSGVLKFLVSLPKDKRDTIFPRLRKLCINLSRCRHYTLNLFLQSRREAGVPIEILQLDFPEQNPEFEDLRSFDKMVGMKVQWRLSGVDREYVCGSGKPEELDLRDQFREWREARAIAMKY